MFKIISKLLSIKSTILCLCLPTEGVHAGNWGTYYKCDTPVWTVENLFQHLSQNEQVRAGNRTVGARNDEIVTKNGKV